MIHTKKIKRVLEPLLEEINGEIPEIQESLLNNITPIENFKKGNKKKPGVYIFFIKPKDGADIGAFEKLWNKENKEIIKFPKIVKSRYAESIKNESKLYPFYIGKSEKVQYRIDEHLNHHGTKTTYGLKLLVRKKLLAQYDFFYSLYELQETELLDKAIIQLIITRIEQRLRLKLKPWVGKQ